MNWILLLRKCLMAELFDPTFSIGGLIRAILGLGGTLSTAEDVRPHEGLMTIVFDNRALAALAEIVLAVSGLAMAPIKIPMKGTMSSPDYVSATDGAAIGMHMSISGYIPSGLIPVAAEGQIITGDVSRGALGMADPITEARGFSSFIVNVSGENPPVLVTISVFSRDSFSIGVHGRLLTAYRYTVEENEAGGLTYRITSDYTEQTDGTLRIGV